MKTLLELRTRATDAGTARRREQFSRVPYRSLGKTGLWVSEVGIGMNRMSVAATEHRDALTLALREGFNVIDTSGSYLNGASEKLAGEVLYELFESQILNRDEVVVITKAGLIREEALDRVREGLPGGLVIQDMISIDSNLNFCMDPEFLSDQITESLSRLMLSTIDIFLIENPEQYLLWAVKTQHMSLSDATAVYYERLQRAFTHLESEVAAGRIGCYGIASNGLHVQPESEGFTSLEQLLELANRVSSSHHFAVVQVPMNLLEPMAATCQNYSGNRTVLDVAKERKLGVLIYRPFNAITGKKRVRLTELEATETISKEDVAHALQELLDTEMVFCSGLLNKLELDEAFLGRVSRIFSIAQELMLYWHGYEDFVHWKEVMGLLVQRVESGVDMLVSVSDNSEVETWLTVYLQQMKTALSVISDYYKIESIWKGETIKEMVAEAESSWAVSGRLNHMALRALRSTEGCDVILIGMRLMPYVEDVLAELGTPIEKKYNRDAWLRLQHS